MIVIELAPHIIRLQIERALYNEAVVFKCLYWYGSHLVVTVNSSPDGLYFDVTLRPKVGVLDQASLDDLEARLHTDLIDFKTRDIVARETKTIRDLLVAKAFAHADDFESTPPGELDDSVSEDARAHDQHPE